MKRSLYLTLVSSLLVAACVYENDEVYVSPVKLEEPDLQINISEVESFRVFRKTIIEWNAKPLDKKSFSAEAKVDGILIRTFYSAESTFKFTFDPQNFSDGQHTLRIEARYQTGNGSLADAVGREYYIVYREWKFTIDKTPPAPLAAPVVAVEDGKMMIRWTTPNRPEFSRMTILRTYHTPYRGDVTDSLKINAPFSTTSFHDVSYVGGPVSYSVDLHGYFNYIKGETTEFNFSPIPLNFDGARNPNCMWQRSRLYNNDLSYELVTTKSYSGEETKNYPVSGSGSRHIPILFGDQSEVVGVKVKANHPAPASASYNYLESIPFFKGIKLPVPNVMKAFYLPSDDAFLIQHSNPGISQIYLSKLRASDMGLISTLNLGQDGSVYASPDREYVYNVTGDVARRIDSHSMNFVGTIINLRGYATASDLYGLDPEISISNNNIMGYNYDNGGKTVVLDLTSKTVLWRADTVSGAQAVVSFDGQYLFCNRMAYKKSGGTYTSLPGRFPSSALIINAGAMTDEPSKIYIFSGGVKVFDVDAATVNGFWQPVVNHPVSGYYTYDPTTNRFSSWLVTNTNNDGIVTEYSSDLQELRVFEDIQYPPYAKYSNGRLFHLNGFCYE